MAPDKPELTGTEWAFTGSDANGGRQALVLIKYCCYRLLSKSACFNKEAI